MDRDEVCRWQDTRPDLVKGVALPLKNLEFLIDEYLMANGCWLDTETRFLLAGVRDSLGRVATSTAQLASGDARGAAHG